MKLLRCDGPNCQEELTPGPYLEYWIEITHIARSHSGFTYGNPAPKPDIPEGHYCSTSCLQGRIQEDNNARTDTCTSTRSDPTYGDYRCQKEPGHTREHQAPSATAAGNICGVVTWWDFD